MDRSTLTNEVSSLRQAANRARLAEAVQDERLVGELVVDVSGYLKVEYVEWDEYWCHSLAGVSDQTRSALNSLRIARLAHLRSGYDLKLAAVYCCRYYELLRLALAGSLPREFLRALAGLDVLPIRRFHSSGTEAAGVITVRHPVYLLARLAFGVLPKT